MRLLCAYVALIVIASFAGVGYAAPGRVRTEQSAVESTATTPPPGGDVAVPEEPVATPDGDADTAEQPAPADPDADASAPEPAAEDKESPTGDQVSVATAAAPVTDPSDATAQGVVPYYVEGNPTCTTYFSYKINGIPDNQIYTGLPGGASIEISNASASGFDFAASGVLIHKVIVKAADGAYIYDYDPTGITADQWLYTVQKVGGGYFDISHVVFCYTQTPSTGHIIIRKYDDRDADDDRDGGEDWLAGFTFRLEQGESEDGPWTVVGEETTEGMYGQADFGNMIAGWYRMTELLTPAQIEAGWTPTADNPRVFYHTGEVNGSDADEECKWFGNRVEKFDKEFKLTYEGAVPSNTTFHAVFTVDGEPYDVSLTGSNPFWSEEFEFRSGAVISAVSWYATWTPTGGSPVEILLGTSAGEVLNCDKVNSFTYGAKIEGYKYEDMDADGELDLADAGLAGWTIVLERQIEGSWYPYQTKLTGASGYYSFYSVLPGHYRVTEDIAAMTDYDWVQSKPGSGYYEVDVNSINTAGDVSVSCVTRPIRLDFMNWAPASLHAVKFHDLDADGEWDDGEPGLSGWVIFVDYDGDGERDADTPLGPEPYAMTGADGTCTIVGVHPGTFPVREQMVTGWNQSVGASYVVTFVSRGEYGLEVPYIFGNWTTATKAGMKFHDLDADGVKDEGEAGLAGWTIYVDYNDNDVLDTDEPSAVTGEGGVYMIWNIVPGTWKVKEVLTGDWVQSYPADGYYEVDFTSELEDTGNDFGNWHPGSVEGYKFNDLNVNGQYDEGEPRLQGWTIYVDLNNNQMHDAEEPSAVTDSSGYFYIDDIDPGSYWLREVQQDPWQESMGDHYVTITSGETAGIEGELDFGNWSTTGLSGYKFEDKDADGTWDFEEPVMSGVEIHLTGADVFGSPVFLTTTTDANGYYEFTGLNPGAYTVSEVVPDGWTQSYPEDGIYQVTLESGVRPETSYDFGNWTFADPHGYKINDLDADGVIDEGEPGLEGWTINIDGITGWGEVYHDDTLTDADGRWEFTDVPPGEYVISETQQSGWTQSFPEDPDDYEMTLESGEIPEESFDFANWTTATKLGMKFFDADGDGLPREEGEIGLAGWTIFVDYDNDGVLDEGEPSDVTDAGGAYMIEGILPGTWYVREVSDDEDWMLTYPASGSYHETFESDGVYEGNDFGNTTWVEKTFELMFETDAPPNTTYSVTFTTEFVRSTPPPVIEEPVAPQAIAIFTEDHEIELEDAGDGTYTASLPVWPQTVITNVEWWAEWNGEDIKLGDGAAEELIDAPMTNYFDYDAEVYGHKWDDTDREDGLPGDGIWDYPAEPGLPGWEIQLYRMNMDEEWVLYDAEVTIVDGSYTFADVLPGVYYLAEVIPLDPETSLPMWTQSAGPMGEGDMEFVVSDGSSTGPVDFGNYEPGLFLTLDMGLTKDVSKSTAAPGDTLVYTLTYTMVQGEIADDTPFSITDDFDEEYLTVIDAAGGTVSDGKIVWDRLGPLTTGESGSITYKLKVDNPMPAGVTNVDNTAVVTLEGDSDPSNNTDSERVKVSVAGEPFLPFTGSEATLVFLVLLMAVAAGLALRFRTRDI